MKLRCTHNSVRLRLRKSDLTTLVSQGRVQEAVVFAPGEQLIFALLAGTDATITVTFRGGALQVAVPAATLHHWMESNQVGIEAWLPVGEQGPLQVLIEKDFPCQHQLETSWNDTFHELVPPPDDSISEEPV